MNSNKTIESIKSNDLFKNLNFASLDIPFDAKNFLEFKEGDLIYSSGQPSDFVYLLINGEVKIKSNSIKRLFFKSPNEYFGETEVLQKEPRNSSALANSDCLLYQIDEPLLSNLVNNYSEIRKVLLFNDNNGSDEVHNTTILEEVNKKISEVESISEPEKNDINHLAESSDIYETTFETSYMENSQFQAKSDLNSFMPDLNVENDNESINSQFNGDQQEINNWVTTEEHADALPMDTTSFDTNYEINESENEKEKTEENEIQDYADLINDLTFKPEQIIEDSSQLSNIANFLMQDVKAPLLTVKHYSSILSRFNLPAEVQKVVALMLSQTNSVLDLLQASMDFSENSTKTKLEQVSFNENIDENLTVLSDYVESRNVKLFKKLGEDASVKIDKRKFYVACYYIARFACDVMNHGGNLYFSSKCENNAVILSIKDENKAIKPEMIKDVFNPHFSYNGNSSTGLSLAISKFLIEAMHATFELHIDDSGTNYRVSIPVSML